MGCFDPTHEAATCKDYIPEVTTPAPSHTGAIVTGVLKGLLSDTDDVEPCLLDAVSTGGSIAAALSELKEGKVMDAIKDLSDALAQVQPTVQDCQIVKDEIAKLGKALKDINVAKAMQNFHNHQTEIMQDLADASTARDGEKYEECGMHLGFAMRKVLA